MIYPMADRRRDHEHEEEPLFVISIAARMVGMHAQSLRHYERLGPMRRAELQSYRDRMLSAVEGEESS